MEHAPIVFPANRSNPSSIACIAGVFEFVAGANAYRTRTGKKELFKVEMAGTTD